MTLPRLPGYLVPAFLLASLAASAALAQDVTPRPRPRLTIATPVEQPVALQSVRISAEIAGSLAETTVEMVFYNPNGRILEGELQFPLADGQTVTGLALELEGRLREAVPVEKVRGRQVFEDVTRQRIDPALLETTAGSNFKLRVYPIPPRETKRVVIRYGETLRAANGRRSWRLPLDYADRLQLFTLAVTVRGGDGRAAAARGLAGGLAFTRAGDDFVARVERKDFAARGALELALPVPATPTVVTGVRDGRHYFYAEVPVTASRAPRTLPRTVGIVWDSSGSGAARDHAREFALLEAYFRRLGSGEVRLVRLRDRAEPVQAFRIADGDWSALRRALESTAYDGATNLGAFAPEPGVGEYLLFSDGLANFGEAPFPRAGVPVYAIAAAAKADPVRLRHIAHASGGRFVDLTVRTGRDAAEDLLTESTRLTALAGENVEALVAAGPFPERGRLAIAGVLTEPAGAIRVGVSGAGAAAREHQVAIRRGAAVSPLAAAAWAGLRIAELEGEYELNRAEIRRLGKRFGLVTRETSLIVLDRVEDYARYEIVPPPELLAEYQRIVGTLAERRRSDERAQLERVVRLFREKEAWWGRDFPKTDRPAARGDLQPRDAAPAELRMESRRALADAPAPAAAPPAARIMARQAASSEAEASQRGGIAIRLQAWSPDAPYAKRLKEASPADIYRVYLDERPSYAASTAFFLDVADRLTEKGLPELAVRVLSNLAELDLENRHVLRILGYRLLQAGEPAAAVSVFKRVLELAPDEPQSYRDLGLAYAAAQRYQEAIDALYEVVVRPWHGRFPEIELIALAELNAIVATCGQKLDASRVDPRLARNLSLDLRVLLTWDADNTDIDLWVTDPNGERAFYGNRLTWQGGRMSQDFTGGYGPEEFSLKTAKPGRYKVEANFYGHRQQIVAGATTLQLKLQTRFGTAQAAEKIVTLRLASQGGVVMVGEFDVGAAQ